MSTRWRIQPFDRDQIAALSRGAGIAPLVAQVLINRGVRDPERARVFLESRLNGLNDPESLPGAVEAADRVVRAIRDDRSIVIYGDYDVDGVCGVSVLWAALKLAGAKRVAYYIPHRVQEGYGVNPDAVRRIAEEHPGALVVTVDCGISAVAESRLARELGLELIVTDHHTIGPELPPADVVVHPRLPGGSYPFGDLCGAAVAFKLAWQICKSFGDGKKASPHLRDYLVQSLGLVAMATVADVVPLKDENRILVRHGLAGVMASPTTGMRALMKVANCLGRSKLTAGTVGFNLAPRINAAGRLERAMRAVEMLTTSDDALADQIADELNAVNQRRQEVERAIVHEAQEQIRSEGGLKDRGAIVLGRKEWHPGVIGIVASRLVEIYHRPTILVAFGQEFAQGSARSVPGFNIYEAIQACSEGLIGFGGHSAAAGVRMSEGHFATFAERFDAHCRTLLTPELRERVLTIDAEVSLAMLNLNVVQDLEKLEPHGMGNPRPLFLASQARVVGEPRAVGEGKKHLQLKIGQGSAVFKAVAWNMAEKGKDLAHDVECSVVFHPGVDEWNGYRRVQLEVKDFVVSGRVPAPMEAAAAGA
ncbi:single-stranded-DNA-specific exonuclease RecJ [Planctomyces sp. SH-PL62]|uniref:single-stranded-DNA-specific exonuclease RecJ n=1 Tax=Planctomyces sp. SH-PL62 TaxID=1636152 RepID=UPI00078CD690|nr:single-stranded-DNA-specific exonuclease RecJ [Planctomyces sp. SH-PL62]AMV39396.1 Single-stranded-DNA-specific exonuclease RecJ [Planctomyces sp. SH-PL62]